MLQYAIVRGTFGEVRLAFVKGTCEKVAVKVIERKGFAAMMTTDAVSSSSYFVSTFTVYVHRHKHPVGPVEL